MLDSELVQRNVAMARNIRAHLTTLMSDGDVGHLSTDLSDLYAAAAHYQQLIKMLLATPPHNPDRFGTVLAELTVEVRHLQYHLDSVAEPLDTLAAAFDE